MAAPLWLFLIAYGVTRAIWLVVSARHEVALRRMGAVEHSVGTTRMLLASIVAYVLAAMAEGAIRETQPDAVSYLGIFLVIEAFVALYVLNRELGGFYTVKVLIAPQHRHVRSAIYDRFRHPIYFFVLVPEWTGIGLALHAWITMLVGLPVLLTLLARRIGQEERALRARFPDYRGLLVRS